MTYSHTDHLGSISALTNNAGTLVEQDAYDPWGKRRNLNGAGDPNDTLTSQTTRGYTDQEHLVDVALIHMNGRVYDPQIGKFTSGDPMVKYPYSSQGFNRFAYVGNNPLKRTDPTGMAADGDCNCNDEITVYGLPDPSAGGGSDVSFEATVALEEIRVYGHKKSYQQQYIQIYGQLLGPDIWGLYGNQYIGSVDPYYLLPQSNQKSAYQRALCEASKALGGWSSQDAKTALVLGAGGLGTAATGVGAVATPFLEGGAAVFETSSAIEGGLSAGLNFAATLNPIQSIGTAANYAFGRAAGLSGPLNNIAGMAGDQIVDAASGDSCD